MGALLSKFMVNLDIDNKEQVRELRPNEIQEVRRYHDWESRRFVSRHEEQKRLLN